MQISQGRTYDNLMVYVTLNLGCKESPKRSRYLLTVLLPSHWHRAEGRSTCAAAMKTAPRPFISY